MSSNENAIVRWETGGEIVQLRPPTQVLAEAKLAATALIEVISLKRNKVTFNGEQYLEFEDWQTVAKFYGCSVKATSTNYVEFGGVHGFEATAVVLDRNQNEISRAESMCLNDEETWGMVAKYEWQDELDGQGRKVWVEGKDGKKGFYKGKKVKIGEVAKPLFQLRSMAQTRACAKALRNIFAWVVVLAGYKPTPAEEMTQNEERYEDRGEGQKKDIIQPQRASAVAQTETKTEAQAGTKTEAKAETPDEAMRDTVVVISGKIEGPMKPGKEQSLWFHLDGKLIVSPQKFVDDDMVVDNILTVRGLRKSTPKVPEFYEVLAILENPSVENTPVQETATQVVETAPENMDAEPPTIEELKQSGVLAPASSLQSPKTIGMARAKRLYAMSNQNIKTNGGFGEAQIKGVLKAIVPPLEHLRDLPVELQGAMEKFCTGEDMGWKKMIGEA